MYMRVLSNDPSQRELVYKDIRLHPLKIEFTEWLPLKYWLSYYKFILSYDQEQAFQFLQSLSAEHLSAHSDLRAVWFRKVAYRCPLKRLADLGVHLSRTRDQSGTDQGQLEPLQMAYSVADPNVQSMVRRVDLSLITELRALCSQPMTSVTRSNLDIMKSRLSRGSSVRHDPSNSSGNDTFGQQKSPDDSGVSQRELLAKSILEKAFKNRVMLDSFNGRR